MKRIIGVLALTALLLLAGKGTAEDGLQAVGKPAPDIRLTCADGTEYSLYDALRDKELAVVCLFGSGCGACQRELRALDEAYRQYQDKVSVIALSLDRTRDTPEALKTFQERMGLSFPLGRDSARTARFLQIRMYPAFMLVKSGGEVVYAEVSGPATKEHFAELFDTYLNDGAPRQEAAPQEPSRCGEEGCPVPGEAEQGE